MVGLPHTVQYVAWTAVAPIPSDNAIWPSIVTSGASNDWIKLLLCSSAERMATL